MILQSHRKVALIIGNGAYSGRDKLGSPPEDASRMANALKDLGFEVEQKTDLDRVAMSDVVDTFIGDLRQRPADVGLFYFSGHGLQIEDQNFLVPIGFEQVAIPTEDALVRLQAIIDRMSELCHTKLIFLDACRVSVAAQELAAAITRTKALASPDGGEKVITVGGKG
jgi:uncharacterized caspase-like protein